MSTTTKICLGFNRALHAVERYAFVNDLGYCPDCYDLALAEAGRRLAEAREAAQRPDTIWLVEEAETGCYGDPTVDQYGPYLDLADATERAWSIKLTKRPSYSRPLLGVRVAEYRRVTK